MQILFVSDHGNDLCIVGHYGECFKDTCWTIAEDNHKDKTMQMRWWSYPERPLKSGTLPNGHWSTRLLYRRYVEMTQWRYASSPTYGRMRRSGRGDHDKQQRQQGVCSERLCLGCMQWDSSWSSLYHTPFFINAVCPCNFLKLVKFGSRLMFVSSNSLGVTRLTASTLNNLWYCHLFWFFTRQSTISTNKNVSCQPVRTLLLLWSQRSRV